MAVSSAEFTSVPVVEVGTENMQHLWPSILLAVKSATFIAIDTVSEFKADKR